MRYRLLIFLLIGCGANARDLENVARDGGSDLGAAIPVRVTRDAGMRRADAAVEADGPWTPPRDDAGTRPWAPPPETAAEPPETDVESDAGVDDDAGVSRVWFEGGDGSSCEEAVVILGAQTDFGSIAAEYAWLAEHYPGYTLVRQALLECDGRFHADMLTIRTARGAVIDVYFNIEESFDK